MFQVKEAETQLRVENERLLQQLYVKEQEEMQKQRQQQLLQSEQENKLHQLQLKLQETQEQYEDLQRQHLQHQEHAIVNSAASTSALRQLQEELLAAQNNQKLEAAAAEAASAGQRQVQIELHTARDRIKYLETAISGHVSRLESQAEQLSGTDHAFLRAKKCDNLYSLLTTIQLETFASMN
jgi:hypothetical protein